MYVNPKYSSHINPCIQNKLTNVDLSYQYHQHNDVSNRCDPGGPAEFHFPRPAVSISTVHAQCTVVIQPHTSFEYIMVGVVHYFMGINMIDAHHYTIYTLL